MRCICSIVLAGASTVPWAIASLNLRACDRKPIFGSAWNSFCQPAVSVQISSQTVGSSVTQA